MSQAQHHRRTGETMAAGAARPGRAAEQAPARPDDLDRGLSDPHHSEPALMPWLITMGPVLRTFVLATIAVPIVIYGLMPRLHRLRTRILTRARPDSFGRSPRCGRRRDPVSRGPDDTRLRTADAGVRAVPGREG